MSKDFNEAVDVLFHKVDDLVSTKTVVGDAIVVGDMTLLPLIDVAVGAGVGAKESANAASGMGARISPSAILMIRPDGSAADQRRIRMRFQAGGYGTESSIS